MGRKSEEPLEKKDVILFKGDWARLEEILRPRKIKPTVFIRKLVRQKLQEIEARLDLTSSTAKEPSHVRQPIDLDSFTIDSGESGESE